MERSLSPLYWDVRVFCFTAWWILICKSRRMLHCSMCFAGWRLHLWLKYPGLNALNPRALEKADVAFQLGMATPWRGRYNPSSTQTEQCFSNISTDEPVVAMDTLQKIGPEMIRRQEEKCR